MEGRTGNLVRRIIGDPADCLEIEARSRLRQCIRIWSPNVLMVESRILPLT